MKYIVLALSCTSFLVGQTIEMTEAPEQKTLYFNFENSTFSFDPLEKTEAKTYQPHVLLKFNAACFIPSDPRFNHIYGANGIYGLELTMQAWKNLYAYQSTNFYYTGGHSFGADMDSATNILLIPLSAGLKYAYPVSIVELWFGGGLLTTYMHIDDESAFVSPSIVNRWGIGGIIKGGILIHATQHFFVDIFADYSFMNISYNNSDHGALVTHTAHLSGASVGGSFGWSF